MDSAIGGSPVVQMRGVERKKRTRPAPILLEASPKRQRILAQPSIASSTSSKFGDERMIRAKRGLLERMSLEESALMAQGEDASFSLPGMLLHQFTPLFANPLVQYIRSQSSLVLLRLVVLVPAPDRAHTRLQAPAETLLPCLLQMALPLCQRDPNPVSISVRLR